MTLAPSVSLSQSYDQIRLLIYPLLPTWVKVSVCSTDKGEFMRINHPSINLNAKYGQPTNEWVLMEDVLYNYYYGYKLFSDVV